MKSAVLTILLCLLLSLGVHSEDKLVSIDAAASLITVEGNKGLKSYRVGNAADITVNGAKVTADKLKPGMGVVLSFAQGQIVSRITIRTAVALPASPRSIDIRMRVDGTDVVKIRGGKVTIEHSKYSAPDLITINGIDWQPKWTGQESDGFVHFKPQLEPINVSTLKMKQTAGRNKVVMTVSPGAAEEKLVLVKFDDLEGGADIYEVQITW